MSSAIAVVSQWSAAEVSVPRPRVRIAVVERGAFVRDVAAEGVVVAAVSPTLVSSAAGTVEYLAQAGDEVRKGQVLAKVDSPDLLNELKREQASLAALELTVERQDIEMRRTILANKRAIDLANVSFKAAERERLRAEDSWAQRLVSKRDYERALDEAAAAAVSHEHSVETANLEKESLAFELRSRRLERDRQRLVVEDLMRQVEELNVKSPVDGVVGTLATGNRSVVMKNAELMTVIDLGAFEIEFSVPESYADDLAVGMGASVAFQGKVYTASVSAVSPEVRQGQVSGRLRFSNENEVPRGLRQNQRVSARIVFESREGVLQVARGSFTDANAGRVAFVVQGDIARRTPIAIGAQSVSAIEILDGLKEGDSVIISSVSEFATARTVRLVD